LKDAKLKMRVWEKNPNHIHPHGWHKAISSPVAKLGIVTSVKSPVQTQVDRNCVDCKW